MYRKRFVQIILVALILAKRNIYIFKMQVRISLYDINSKKYFYYNIEMEIMYFYQQ